MPKVSYWSLKLNSKLRYGWGAMIYPLQIRAARALLDMSQLELAERASVGIATIKRIEAAGRTLVGNARTVARIQAALEEAGVEFIDGASDRGPGVRLKRSMA